MSGFIFACVNSHKLKLTLSVQEMLFSCAQTNDLLCLSFLKHHWRPVFLNCCVMFLETLDFECASKGQFSPERKVGLAEPSILAEQKVVCLSKEARFNGCNIFSDFTCLWMSVKTQKENNKITRGLSPRNGRKETVILDCWIRRFSFLR